VLNGRWAPSGTAVVLSVKAEIGTPNNEALGRDFRLCSADPLIGNLLMVGTALVDDHLALDVMHSKKRRHDLQSVPAAAILKMPLLEALALDMGVYAAAMAVFAAVICYRANPLRAVKSVFRGNAAQSLRFGRSS